MLSLKAPRRWQLKKDPNLCDSQWLCRALQFAGYRIPGRTDAKRIDIQHRTQVRKQDIPGQISKIKNPKKYERSGRIKKIRHRCPGDQWRRWYRFGVEDLDSHGIQCVHAPKTMDLDLMPYSVVGFTINRIAFFVSERKPLDAPITGWWSSRFLDATLVIPPSEAAGEPIVLIPEIPVDWDEVYRHLKKVYIKRICESDIRAGTYTIVVAEGLKIRVENRFMMNLQESTPLAIRNLQAQGNTSPRKSLRNWVPMKTSNCSWSRRDVCRDLYTIPEVRTITPSHLSEQEPL